jgi:hypothetical protein
VSGQISLVPGRPGIVNDGSLKRPPPSSPAPLLAPPRFSPSLIIFAHTRNLSTGLASSRCGRGCGKRGDGEAIRLTKASLSQITHLFGTGNSGVTPLVLKFSPGGMHIPAPIIL